MKKSFLLLSLILLSVIGIKAQTVLYSEDFESSAGTDWKIVQGDPTFAVGIVDGINNTTKMMSSADVKQSIVALQGKTFEGAFTIEAETYPSFNNAGIIVNYVDNENFVAVTIDNNDKRVRVRQVVGGVWDGQFPAADGNKWRFWKDENFVSDSLGIEMLAWAEGKPNTIKWKIDVDPDLGTVSVSIDGKSILKDVSVVLPQYKANIAIWTWWCRHAFDNIKVTSKMAENPSTGSSFSEDFENTDGKSWNIVMGDPTFTVAKVDGLNNTTKMLTSSDVKESLVVLKDKQFEGAYTLEFDDYPSFNIGGAVINYVDNQNFVCVTANNNSRRISVRQVVNGQWDGQFPKADGEAWRFWKDENFVSDSIGFDKMAWAEGKPDMIHWKIMVDPDLGTVTVYIDGNLIMKDVSVVLPQYKATVGIYSWWCRRAIDNFKVTQSTVGVKDFALQNPLKLYPNPVVGGQLNVDASKLDGKIALNVYSVNGAKMTSQTTQGGSLIHLDVSNLKAGIYFLNVANSKGVSINQKFIVR